MNKISVIIVTWNAGKTLTRCVEALEAQRFRDFDLLIVDNHSSDNSVSEAVFASLRSSGIEVALHFRPENTGFAAAVNFGAERATGEYIALLNPDAYPALDWLEALADSAERHQQIESFGSVQIDAGNANRLDGLGDVYHGSGIAWRGGYQQSIDLIPREDKEIFAACAAACLYRRERFLALGGMDESFFCYHEDVDYGFRLRLAGGKSILVHSATVLHEGSASTGRRSDFAVYHGTRNRVRTFIKNMPTILLWPLLPLHIASNLFLLLRSAGFGVITPFWRGLWDGFFNSSRAWKDRAKVQTQRKVSAMTLAKSFTWSPLALIKRSPDMRDCPDRT